MTIEKNEESSLNHEQRVFSEREQIEHLATSLAELALLSKEVLADGKFSVSKHNDILLLEAMSNEIIDRFVVSNDDIKRIRDLKLA